MAEEASEYCCCLSEKPWDLGSALLPAQGSKDNQNQDIIEGQRQEDFRKGALEFGGMVLQFLHVEKMARSRLAKGKSSVV